MNFQSVTISHDRVTYMTEFNIHLIHHHHCISWFLSLFRYNKVMRFTNRWAIICVKWGMGGRSYCASRSCFFLPTRLHTPKYVWNSNQNLIARILLRLRHPQILPTDAKFYPNIWIIKRCSKYMCDSLTSTILYCIYFPFYVCL